MSRLIEIALVISLTLTGSRSLAQDMPISAEMQYSLFVRILTFDRALENDAVKKIVIGVLYQEGVRMSVETKDEFLFAAAHSTVKQILGKPIVCVPVSANGATLQETLDREEVVIMYLTPLRAFDVQSLADMMAKKKIVTLTGVPDYVRNGIAIGLDTRLDSPVILVNLEEAKRQGADLSAQLLKIATIVK